MIKTIYIDSTGLIVKINSYLKPCVDCGRWTSYIIRKQIGKHNIYGFRVCWEHLSQRERTILENYYIGI